MLTYGYVRKYSTQLRFYKCLIKRHVSSCQVITRPRHIKHKKEIQKFLAYWKLRSLFLETDIHVPRTLKLYINSTALNET